jgi:hypothetical protein
VAQRRVDQRPAQLDRGGGPDPVRVHRLGAGSPSPAAPGRSSSAARAAPGTPSRSGEDHQQHRRGELYRQHRHRAADHHRQQRRLPVLRQHRLRVGDRHRQQLRKPASGQHRRATKAPSRQAPQDAGTHTSSDVPAGAHPVPLEYSIGWVTCTVCRHDGRSGGWLAGCCSRSFTCLVCRVPGLAVLVFWGDKAKDAGLLVLGHENAVLRRHGGRIRDGPARSMAAAARAGQRAAFWPSGSAAGASSGSERQARAAAPPGAGEPVHQVVQGAIPQLCGTVWMWKHRQS